MAATKYIARFNGQIVGKRSTRSRTYKYAVVVQSDYDDAVAKAKALQPTGIDASNYKYTCAQAACGVDEYRARFGWGMPDPTVENITKAIDVAKAKVEGGFEAYFERVRQGHLDWIEAKKVEGSYTPRVATWCSRRDLALRASTSKQHVSDYWLGSTRFLAIVDAEEV